MRISFCIVVVSATIAAAQNYSVQLMQFVQRPEGWTQAEFASAADSLITTSNSEVISNCLEELAIQLQSTEDEIRQQIDDERALLDLPPLPPWDMELDMSKLIDRWFSDYVTPEEDLTTFLPESWQESNYESVTEDDLDTLTADDLEKLLKRAEQEDTVWRKTNNKPDLFVRLPKRIEYQLTDYLHEQIRQEFGLPPGVRVYKRKMAVLTQALMALDPEKWGYVLYRTTYKNETAWDDFETKFKNINDVELRHPNKGLGVEQAAPFFEMLMAIEHEVPEGATFFDCAEHFRGLQSQGEGIPDGVDIPLILVVDEASLSSITDLQHGIYPFIWAVDVTYKPSTRSKFPAEYKGYFKIHYMAHIHELYAPIASHFMTPVQLWQMLQHEMESRSMFIEDFILAKERGKREKHRYRKVADLGKEEKSGLKDEL